MSLQACSLLRATSCSSSLQPFPPSTSGAISACRSSCRTKVTSGKLSSKLCSSNLSSSSNLRAKLIRRTCAPACRPPTTTACAFRDNDSRSASSPEPYVAPAKVDYQQPAATDNNAAAAATVAATVAYVDDGESRTVVTERAPTPMSAEDEHPRKVLQDITALAVPALGAVLADPLMSLVDTACVGQIGAIELASLGPNTAIFAFVFSLFSFVGTATCARIAKSSAATSDLQRLQQRETEAAKALCHGLTIAAMAGVVVMLVLEALAPQLLRWMGAGDSLMKPGLEYLRVRALSAPAVMALVVGQGASLGEQNMRAPLVFLWASGLLNLAGDYFLTVRGGWGVGGTAWATVVSQYLGAALFLWWFARRSTDNKMQTVMVNGQLKYKPVVRLQWHGLPDAKAIRHLLKMSSALFLRTICAMTTYSLMTFYSTKISVLATAAHQVALQMFWFFTYFPEPLSVTAQSLIARDLSMSRTRVRRMGWLLLAWGAGLGVVLGTALLTASLWGQKLFSPDAAVGAAVASVGWLAALSAAICSVVMVFDGISVGIGAYGHLGRMQLVCMMVVGSFLALFSQRLGFVGVWCGMLMFFVLRFSQHVLFVARRWDTHILGTSSASAA